MTNIKKVLQGIVITTISLTTLVLITWFVPPIINSLVASLGFAELEETIWIGIIALYIILGLIYPTYTIIDGIQEKNNNGKIQNITIALTLFFFASILTYKAWYMIPTIMNLPITTESNVFLSGIFYVSIFINWFLITIGTPSYMIIHALQDGE